MGLLHIMLTKSSVNNGFFDDHIRDLSAINPGRFGSVSSKTIVCIKHYRIGSSVSIRPPITSATRLGGVYEIRVMITAIGSAELFRFLPVYIHFSKRHLTHLFSFLSRSSLQVLEPFNEF